MKLTKEQCDILVKSAFKDLKVPEYSTKSINNLLMHVNSDMRDVVILRITKSLSFDKIANELGKYSGGYYSVIYRRFLDKLKELIEHDWDSDTSIKIGLDTSIEVLNLSVRANNVLRRYKIITVGDLCNLTQQDLHKFMHMGSKCESEIIKALKFYGFSLKPVEVEEPVKIKSGFSTTVISEMLPVIYSKCAKRTKQYGYAKACKACPYKGTNEADCMFNLQPRIWVVEK